MQSGADRLATATALLVIAFVVGLTVRYNSFIPWGTDSGAYISSAYRWAEGDVFSPATLLFHEPWAADGYVEAPLGHRPGPVRGTFTSFYPIGYPLLLAVALRLGGELAPYAVAPLLAGVLAWCAFLLARRLSTAWAGAAAALMIAATPVTLTHAIMPMSDVPAAAFWALAWVMSLRAGRSAAATAGLAAAFAVMIRPNLAPLALPVAVAVAWATLTSRRDAVARVVVFGIGAAVGPAMVLWSQAALFGHPLESGYPAPLEFFFQAGRIPHNAWFYPAELVGLHSWLVASAVAAVPLVFARRFADPDDRHRRAIVASAVGIIAVNYALYLPYLSFDGWYWLRFTLPAMLAIFVLCAAAFDWVRLALGSRHRWLAVLAAVPVAVIVLTPAGEMRAAVAGSDSYARLHQMGHYLRAALPRRAVVLTYAHGGAVASYTGLPIVRLDMIPLDSLDRVVGDLQRSGHVPVFVLDVSVEGRSLAERFQHSRYVRLDWPPRAEFATTLSVLYHDPADRDFFLSGDRYASDVLVWPPERGDQHRLAWAGLVADDVVWWPSPDDSRAFRTTLEATYRSALGRRETRAHVHPGAATLWLRRYLRYRIHACGHDEAIDKVIRQLDGAGPQAVCGTAHPAAFPPRDQTVDFRRRLDARPRAVAGIAAMTAVDLEGDAVWTQEYVQRRAAGCSHRQATDAVVAAILGQPVPPCGGAPAGR